MRILVTAIGSFSADCVIRTLRQNNHFVVGTDIYPGEWHSETFLCNKFYQSPLAIDEDTYIAFLLDVCKRENIRLLLPLTDIEIDKINAHRSIFEKIGVILAMPSEYTLSLARNKIKLHNFFLNEAPIPSIESYLANNVPISESLLPMIAKPVDGRSSEGILKICTLDELVSIRKQKNYIVQRCIDGPVITVDYVRSERHNLSFSVAREELLRTKNGAGTTVRLFEDLELQSIVDYVGKKLKINGCVNMEFIKNSGKYYLIDVNPRFSAGVAFSKLGGYDMVVSHINCHCDEMIDVPVKIEEQIVVKRYIEEKIK